MPRLSTEERYRLLGNIDAGKTVKEVSNSFHISERSVYKLLRKYRGLGTAKNLQVAGRPRKTSREDDEDIVNEHENRPFKTASATARERGLSKDTILRRLKCAGLKSRKAAIAPLLTDINKHKRLVWERNHHRWTLNQWSRVLFTDEASFAVDSCDRGMRCFRRRNERHEENKVQAVKNRGYGTVMVWGGIFGDCKTPLVRVDGKMGAQEYIDQILTNSVVPFLKDNRQIGCFMHDNAPPHRALITRAFLAENNIPTLDWPSVSPDLNPIENLWGIMKRQLKNSELETNPDALFLKLTDIWDNIPAKIVKNLTQSMLRRLAAVRAAHGGYTKY